MKYSEISKILKEAKKQIDQKEYQKAIDILTPIIEDDKLNNPYPFMVQLLAEAKGNYQEVLKKCDALIAENEAAYFYHTVKGGVYYDLKEYDKALECYDEALKLDKTYVTAYNNKGNIYANLKKYDKALECYNKAIELDSEYASAYYNKGYLYYNLKEYDKALEWYDKAIEVDNEYVYAYNGKGYVYEGLKEYEKALEWYDKAVEVDENYVLAYRNRGNTYYILKKYEKAIADYNKAIALHPDYKYVLKYRIETAQTELEEQKKNQQNQDRDQISNIIEDIKETLEYTGDQVCHYTVAPVLKELCKGSKLRFSHVGLVNDPTEGKTLYDFLKVDAIERPELSGFIGSFVESQNNNFLPLWRAYGRDGEGVSICLDTKILTQKKIEKDSIEKIEMNVFDSKIDKRKLYKIAYIDEKGNIYLDGKKNAVLKRDLKKLKNVLAPLISNVNISNEETLEPLVEIQYLFKNAIYMVEREVRYYDLWKNKDKIIKWDLNLSPPTTYIEVENDIRNSIKTVTLGPKAKDASTWMALYTTMLAREGNTKVIVTQSKIPYR